MFVDREMFKYTVTHGGQTYVLANSMHINIVNVDVVYIVCVCEHESQHIIGMSERSK